MKTKQAFNTVSSFVFSMMPCHSLRVMAASLIVSASLAGVAEAAISISNFTLSSTTVSFTVSGTMPTSVPGTSAQGIYFVNSVAANPGFVTPPSFVAPISSSETLSQNLSLSFPLFTGNSSFSTGDYFGLLFAASLTGGEAVNGDVTATFAPGTFNPAEVSLINVIWGDDGSSFSGGTFLTSITPVPEPSGLVLGLLGGLACLRRRR